jgi:hypothetical protein
LFCIGFGFADSEAWIPDTRFAGGRSQAIAARE